MFSTLQRIVPFFGFKSRSRSTTESALNNHKHDDTDCSEAWQTLSKTDTIDCVECNRERNLALESERKTGAAVGLTKHYPFSSKSEYVVSEDISYGLERIKIPAVSYKRNDKAPRDYHYVPKYVEYHLVDVDRSLKTMSGCRCRAGSCDSGSCYCSSWHKSGRYYDSKGRLARDYNIESPQVIYECNLACNCDRKICKNMVIQGGCLARVVLFKTKSRGWGVRTLEDLRRGTFVGVYSGELISAADSVHREDDTYLFNLSATDIYHPSTSDQAKNKPKDEAKLESEQNNQKDEQFVCDAKFYGNFTRFINHSCEPNVIGIRSFTEHHDSRFPYIAFFTNRDIPANSELTLNYGDNYWLVKCKRDNIYCLCKRSACRFSKKTFQQTLKQYNKRKQESRQN